MLTMMTYIALRDLIYKVTNCNASEDNGVMQVKYKLNFEFPITVVDQSTKTSNSCLTNIPTIYLRYM